MGAHNWQPMSFSAATGLVYIPVQEAPALLTPNKDAAFDNRIGAWNIGLTTPLSEDPKAIGAAVDSFKGHLVAWDPVAQKKVWSQDYKGIWNGGTLSTAGNLVFQGTADGRFVAYSADKGDKLWEAPANTGVLAGPMSYEVDGEQYVAVMAGWGGAFPLVGADLANIGKVKAEARVLVYKLGGKAQLPPPRNEFVALPELPPLTADVATIADGGDVFIHHCAICHGLNAVSAGVLPDLRYLTPEKHAQFAGIVAGARADQGMPSFAGRIAPADVEALHQYIIKRAYDLKADVAKANAQH
jgi:quinohemoprotein ethanol dehydrogenase